MASVMLRSPSGNLGVSDASFSGQPMASERAIEVFWK